MNMNVCERCGEIDPEMIIVHDVLWSKIRKLSGCNFLCQDCMEETMGRSITLNDLKYLDDVEDTQTIMIPSNFRICRRLNYDNKVNLRYLTEYEFITKYLPKDVTTNKFHVKRLIRGYNRLVNFYKKYYLQE